MVNWTLSLYLWILKTRLSRKSVWIGLRDYLLLYAEVKNTIVFLTVVCRVTKYALFIPTRENTTAVDFAELFFEHVECRFGTPRSIVSDRDSRITSDFWREVCEIKMIKTYVVIALKIIQPGLDYFRLCNIIMAVTRLCNSKSEISSSYLPNI